MMNIITNKWFIIVVAIVIILVIYFGFLNNQRASDFPGGESGGIHGGNSVSPDVAALQGILADDGVEDKCGKECRLICKCNKIFRRGDCKRKCKSDCAQGLPYKTKAAEYCK